MTFAFLLTSGPDRQDRHTLAHLVEAALAQGHNARIFLMGDGVVHKDWLVQQFSETLVNTEGSEGLQLAICAHNAEQCGLERSEGIVWGSQADWAQFVNQADRVITIG